jgi:hypothetical protein
MVECLLCKCEALSLNLGPTFYLIQIQIKSHEKNHLPFLKKFFLSLFIYSYVHTLFAIFPLCPLPLLSTPSHPGRTCSALFSNFAEE